MTVEEILRGEVTVFRLSGELDMSDAPALKEKLLARATGDRPRAVVNLERVNYIDSAGLGVLIGALKAYTAKRGGFVLASPRPTVQHILQITRLTQQFKVYATETDAIAAVS